MGMTSTRVDSSGSSFYPPSEYPARFRFPITWSYVTIPLSPAPASPPKVQQAIRPTAVIVSSPMAAPSAPPPTISAPSVLTPSVPTPTPLALAPTPQPRPAPTRTELQPRPVQQPAASPAARADGQWEMVIPKMARPIASRPTAKGIAARVPTPETKPPENKAPENARAASEATFSFYTLQESFVPRRWKVLILGAASLVALGLFAWVRPTGSSTPAATTSPESSTGAWSRRTAYLIGSKDPREIVVYDGSNGLQDYRIEFGWVPEDNGVGLLFRAQDSANYYAVKIRQIQPGPTPAIALEHFTVIQGVEGPHARKVITLPKTLGAVPIRLDASGPAFTLHVQGNPVDYWNDLRFASGSLGFYEDHGARPLVQTLRFTFLKKGGTQTVLASLE
jgi:hypothetical protein